jgi:hypothetical protein
MTGLCAATAVFGLGQSLLLGTALTAGLGLAFGLQLSPVAVAVQNALELPDNGIGLSVMMFFRLIGGALGVALLTAILVSGLSAGAASAPGHLGLGGNPGITILHLDQTGQVDPASMQGLAYDLRTAFRSVFWYATAISAVTAIGSFGLKEIALRQRLD